MKPSECPMCKVPRSMIEGPLHDSGYFCNGCGKVFHVDADGKLIQWGLTNHTAESAFRQAVKAAAKSAV